MWIEQGKVLRYGEQFNDALRQYVVNLLTDMGIGQ